MSDRVRQRDLSYYEWRTDAEGPAMTWGMYAIGHLEGDPTPASLAKAAELFNRSFANTRVGPFGVWPETTKAHALVNFITGAGGFLQTALFGYGGLRIREGRLTLRPRLIEGTTALRLRGLHFRGFVFDVWHGGDATIFTLRGAPSGTAAPLVVASDQALAKPFRLGASGARAAFSATGADGAVRGVSFTLHV
eukprot:CAMPEP_0181231230 /NCGR_PEP_ID=MMETSP1096-20121128/34973_1 /TAXON_ID=156174 ORGANISM="Chrysochromulina ericina, Strain CCMP281" /NCGR_SAMPLE_ID=MMETSP1096 /ASSEMBLY_ACC=CAM_ASM_000453 /LENGTH=192 /DNA_ID=CAMNT_0023325213 /DNA_START=27 /DNA_END=605 /DNA_ORIENTATION=+